MNYKQPWEVLADVLRKQQESGVPPPIAVDTMKCRDVAIVQIVNKPKAENNGKKE